MMHNDCEILPGLIKITHFLESDETENMLFRLFNDNFFNLYYRNKPIHIRQEPLVRGKPETFFHIICDHNLTGHEYNTISQERAQRLLWGPAIIMNEPCNIGCDDCDGIYVWYFDYQSKNGVRKRLKLYHKKYSYLVILEERNKYWLYITSYRVDNSQSRRKLILEYKKQRVLNHS